MRGLRTISMVICAIFAAQILVGCAALSKYGKLEKSARQAYERGAYDLAVFRCVESLRVNPQYDKAQVLIKNAFRVAVNAHQDKIRALKASSAKFRWDDIAAEYEALIKLSKAIRALPTLTVKKTKEIIKIEVTDYTEDLAEAKTNAAEAHYQEGLRLSKKEGMDIQKQAAKEFKAVERFSLGYKDAASLYEKCRQAGVKRMAIIPFEDKSGKGGKYGALSEMITDEIISNVINDPSAMEFLELVSRDQLEQVMREQQLGLTDVIDAHTAVQLGKVLGVHEILTGKITQIIYTPERTVPKKVKEEANVVVEKEKYVDDKGKTREKNVYGDVYATVTIYTKTSQASIGGSYKIIEVKTAKIKKSESFSRKASFSHQWATYSGDKRALSRGSKSLTQKSEELAPAEEEMVNEAARSLSTSLTETLKEYAR